jgi:hypothetical protein
MSTPRNWLEIPFGISAIQSDGAPVTGSPGELILNFLGTTVTDNPANGSTDVVIPSGNNAPTARVAVAPGSTSTTAAAYSRQLIDLSGGDVIVKLPFGEVAGVRVSFKIRIGPVSPSASLTVDANTGTVEQPLEQAMVGMHMAATATFEQVGDLGTSITYECDGSNNWEIV